MTEKELRKLNRYELLEMMVAQAKKLERLERELAEANEKLKERELIMTSSGTMAEAALRLNRVFEAADSAAGQYLNNIKLMAEDLISEAKRRAEQIIKDAESRAQQIAPLEENDDPKRKDDSDETGNAIAGRTE